MRAAIDHIVRDELSRDAAVFYSWTRPRSYTAADTRLAKIIELAAANRHDGSTLLRYPSRDTRTADPEVILLGDAAYGATADVVKARPGWNVMTAVKDGQIRPVDDVVITRPGPRLVEGLRLLAVAIHPDADIPGAPSSAESPSPAASAAP